MKHLILAHFLGLLIAAGATVCAQEPAAAKVPPWDARGLGPLPRMGITSLDVSDDGAEIAVGTIASFGDPNVLVLNAAGKLVRQYQVGQRWISQVAFAPGSKDVFAICTMPAGKAGDRPEVFRLSGDAVVPEKIKQETPAFFHYGDHSNHATLQLARAKDACAILIGNQLVIHRKGKEPATLRVPVTDPDASVSLAVDSSGWAVVGTTTRESAAGSNLYLFDPDQKKPVWSRAVNKDVEKAPALEKGLYGTPTLPDGTRKELPQRDEKVWAPLSVAISSSGGKKLIAVADYQGWQRWVRSSATMKEENQGLRFMPTKPTVTVYNQMGKIVRHYGAATFKGAFWCELHLDMKRKSLDLSTHHWKSRGLAGQALLPTENPYEVMLSLENPDPLLDEATRNHPSSDLAISENGDVVQGWWDGTFYLVTGRDQLKGPLTAGPMLIRFAPDGERFFVANTNGTVTAFDLLRKQIWQTDLNTAVPKSLKPWLANARATPIVPGVWQIPGGRVESDLGGQRLIEAPDGYILIEGHAGLSFEREWAAIAAVGLDPMKVKYVLATHEHGDHAPGAYLWRVVTGAKFVCSEEMAYTLQHHIPLNIGYGLHPPVPTDIRVTKDSELDLAGLKVRAVRIPGHTYGSMAWHFEKSGKSFVAFGDLIMPRGVLGYAGSVNFSATDILSSLRKLHDLKVDYVLPGHGAVEGPGNYFQAGVDVGTAVGWGFIKPERPDPRFRITKKNVVVVAWNQQATSAAFGDVNGDGKPDVIVVAPAGDESVVKFFLNHDGKFNDQPDHEIRVPVSQPHKIRVTSAKNGPHLLVAGKTAAILQPAGKFPNFKIVPIDFADGNHLRFLDDGTPLVSRRFGGTFAVDLSKNKPALQRFVPEIDGPYVDLRMIGKDLLTSYGQLYRRGDDGKFPKTPAMQLPRTKDWTFLAVGDFNGDGKPDAALLSYGMDQATTARIFFNTGKADRMFADKEDAAIGLSALLSSAKKGQEPPLVRDTPVVADWNGDGIDDLIVAHGQSDEMLILLGGKGGLTNDRIQRLQFEYRAHYEHGVFVGDFNGDGNADLAVFGYTNTGVGASGPPAVYLWLQ